MSRSVSPLCILQPCIKVHQTPALARELGSMCNTLRYCTKLHLPLSGYTACCFLVLLVTLHSLALQSFLMKC